MLETLLHCLKGTQLLAVIVIILLFQTEILKMFKETDQYKVAPSSLVCTITI